MAACAIREPSLDDAEAIAALHVSTWRETYAHLLPSDFFTEQVAESRRRMWKRILTDRRPEHAVRVAEVDGELVGFSMAGSSEDRTGRQLFMLYVGTALHGAGVGQALFEAVLPDGPALLWVATENARAIAFYRRNGFRVDGAEQSDPRTPGIIEARMTR